MALTCVACVEMGACLTAPLSRQVSLASDAQQALQHQPVGEARDIQCNSHTGRMDAMCASMEALQSTVAQLSFLASSLQRDNDSLRCGLTDLKAQLVEGHLHKHELIEASLPGSCMPGTQQSGQASHVRPTLPGRPCPSGTLISEQPHSGDVVSQLSQLQVQVFELGTRLGAVEGAVQSCEETLEARRAAELFKAEILKLEQVGIPTAFSQAPGSSHSRRDSGAPSGSTSAAMSFADDLPSLEGLPHCRYPRMAQHSRTPSATPPARQPLLIARRMADNPQQTGTAHSRLDKGPGDTPGVRSRRLAPPKGGDVAEMGHAPKVSEMAEGQGPSPARLLQQLSPSRAWGCPAMQGSLAGCGEAEARLGRGEAGADVGLGELGTRKEGRSSSRSRAGARGEG
ncbi:hypothetical protein V8C86DRAFT_2862067 [Haematococcus lacustris]